MQTIDEISIGRDGDMFTLTIYAYNPDDPDPYEPTMRQTFVIGLPDQFHAETQRTIGQWLTPPVGGRGKHYVNPSDWPFMPDALTHDAQGDND